LCIVSDHTSEAGNVKYCYDLDTRSDLRFSYDFKNIF